MEEHHEHDHSHVHSAEGGKGLARVIRVLAGGALLAAGMLGMFPETSRLWVFLIAYLFVAGDVVLNAVRNVLKGDWFDENFLMSVASIGAFAIGEYPEGVAVMLFYQVGEYFQDAAVRKSRKSIVDLMNIRPDMARIRTQAGEREVSPDAVSVGDEIIVKAGERIPLDGVVVAGRASLDTSALTGETLPRTAREGDDVLSGAINNDGLLVVRVTRLFGESTVSRILDMVQNAASKKAPTEHFITKFSKIYTPIVLLLALCVAVLPPLAWDGAWNEWIRRALVLLVISCPCALVLSVPLSFFAGIGNASRRGILVKGGNYLEALSKVDMVVFDKTGTLTQGVFDVVDVRLANGFGREEVMDLVAHAERGSNHAIAGSIGRAYGRTANPGRVTDYEEMAGFGIRALVDGRVVLAGNAGLLGRHGIDVEPVDSAGSVVYVAVDGIEAGALVIADKTKVDSRETVLGLRDLGVRMIIMLTGDLERIGLEMKETLELDEVRAELLPDQKVMELERLARQRRSKGTVVFVGDGINDAPVLARADVGVAMGHLGSDAAIEAADVVLMTDEPSRLVDAIRIARRTKKLAVQNIVFAVGVKIVVLSLGVVGVATMWEAVFADVGVALLAVLNAMRGLKG